MFKLKLVCSSLLHRVGLILAKPLCIFGNWLPAEGQAPVEVSTVGGPIGGHRLVELKGVEVNGGDFWTNHCGGLLDDAGQ